MTLIKTSVATMNSLSSPTSVAQKKQAFATIKINAALTKDN